MLKADDKMEPFWNLFEWNYVKISQLSRYEWITAVAGGYETRAFHYKTAPISKTASEALSDTPSISASAIIHYTQRALCDLCPKNRLYTQPEAFINLGPFVRVHM